MLSRAQHDQSDCPSALGYFEETDLVKVINISLWAKEFNYQ